MKAVIMAGGEGTRLRPITCDMPKPMAPILGRPVMDYILELLAKHGFDEAMVTLHYLPNAIQDYFKDGSSHKISLRYAVEDRPLGTAGSVKNAIQKSDEDFFVISGDAMCGIDLTKAAEFHKKSGADATLVLSRVKRPLEYGVVVVGENGEIVRFLEKPGWPQAFADTVNTGIYILSPQSLEMIPKDRVWDFSKDLFPAMLQKGMKLYGFVSEDYWCDIGDIPAYLSCHKDLLNGAIDTEAFCPDEKGNIILSVPQIGEEAVISPPCYIGRNVHIGSGAVVGPYAVLGDNTQVGDGASVKNSVLHEGSSLVANSHIRGAILCRSSHLSRNCNAYEGVVVGTGAQIGQGSFVSPGVKIWPGRRVEEGSTVNTDVIWEDAYSELIFGGVISGEAGVLITPEFAARLGAAIGCTLGKSCAVSCDGSGVAKLIKSAVISGILCAGTDVWNFGDIILGGHLFGIGFSRLESGVYISMENDLCNIYLCGADGLTLPRGTERKIENAFYRDAGRGRGINTIGQEIGLSGLEHFYKRALLESGSDFERDFFLFGEDVKGLQLLEELIKELGGKFSGTPRNDAIGFGLANGGRSLLLVDEKGNFFDSSRSLGILGAALLKSGLCMELAPDYSAPAALDELFKKYGGRVLRVLTSPVDGNDTEARALRKSQPWFSDGPFAAMTLIRCLGILRSSLHELVEEIPDFAVKRRDVRIDNGSAGDILRRLAADGGRAEFLEGVGLYRSGARILVIPKGRGGVLSVSAEASNSELAEELCEDVRKRIEALSKKNR